MRQYQNLSGSGACHVQILDKYLSKLPSQAKEKDVFYLTPNKLVDDSKPWYSLVPIGRNRLGSMLKDMCAEANVAGKFSNHSLRAFGATTLYRANLPEKLIQERTGHQCLKALRQYESTSDSQLLEVSNIISSTTDNFEAPGASSALCNVPKMNNVQRHGTAIAQKSDGISFPVQPAVPGIASFLKGCNFSNYNVTFTASTASTNKS